MDSSIFLNCCDVKHLTTITLCLEETKAGDKFTYYQKDTRKSLVRWQRSPRLRCD